MFNNFYLSPHTSQKSYYKKAIVKPVNDASFVLQSYKTDVCKLFWIDGNAYFVKLWGGYSATSMKHINSFLSFFGFPQYGGKKWWDNLPYGEAVKL